MVRLYKRIDPQLSSLLPSEFQFHSKKNIKKFPSFPASFLYEIPYKTMSHEKKYGPLLVRTMSNLKTSFQSTSQNSFTPYFGNTVQTRKKTTKLGKRKYLLKEKPASSEANGDIFSNLSSYSKMHDNALNNESNTEKRITPTQRISLALYSAFSALENPERGDMIALLGDTTGYFALKRLHGKMLQDPVGKKILEVKPILNSETLFPFTKEKHIDEQKIQNYYVKHTLGYEYIHFMQRHGFNPDDRAPVKFIEDPELAYVMARYRQVHDFLHVLTDLPPTVLGEIALKWFECIMTGLPSTTISAVVGPLRLNGEERTFLRDKLIPWAVRYGRQATPLTCIDFESILHIPLEEARKMVGIAPAPKFTVNF